MTSKEYFPGQDPNHAQLVHKYRHELETGTFDEDFTDVLETIFKDPNFTQQEKQELGEIIRKRQEHLGQVSKGENYANYFKN